MPVNDRYPLADVLAACLRWHEARKRQVFVEYLMLDGVNDRYEQAVALAELLQPRNAFKVNLIPYNPTELGVPRLHPPGDRTSFKEALERARRARHRAADPRPRHRRGLRPARGTRATGRLGAEAAQGVVVVSVGVVAVGAVEVVAVGVVEAPAS